MRSVHVLDSGALRRVVTHRKRVVAARYDMVPAQSDFGYVPRISFHDGLTQLKHSWPNTGAVTR